MKDYIRIPSPLGMLRVEAEGGCLAAIRPEEGVPRRAEEPLLRAAEEWLRAYFAGERPEPDALPLAPAGSDFSRRVWERLRAIPYGESISYGELALELDSAARAVGGAVGRNPLLILIPCHRVLGAGRKLTGFAWGLERKKTLLELEGISYRE